jgi:hypothetical protein
MNNNNLSFVKNPDSLKEDHKMDDLFQIEKQKEFFENFLNSLDHSSIVGYLGRFGVGKSTLLHQIKKQREQEEGEIWINFEAWKFPERKELWDGFVLDFAKQVSNKLYKKCSNKIEGKQNDGKKVSLRIFSDLSGLSVLKNFNSFLEKTPAKRIFEIQDILNEAIKKIDKDIYIVAEDLDRSGSEGLFFLETLKQFIRDSLDFKHKIIVIAPISNEIFREEKSRDSLLKSIDYFYEFDFKVPDLINFQKNILKNDFCNELNRNQLNSFFKALFRDSSEIMTPRLLKLILRKADRNFIRQKRDGYNPDFRITIAMEASKYFKSDSAKTRYYFDDFKISEEITKSSIMESFLFIVFADKDTIATKNQDGKNMYYRPDVKFKFVDLTKTPEGEKEPWVIKNPHGNEKVYNLRKFYLDY